MLAAELQKIAANTKLPSREDQLLKLRTEEYDVLVIGGGATGCGVTLDAASRGKHDHHISISCCAQQYCVRKLILLA